MKKVSLLKVAAKIIRNNIAPGFRVKRGEAGTTSARYCYSVWMRHLVTAYNNGLESIPKRVAEFGPGYSIGVGLCAMLCGTNHYYSLDYVKYATSDKNLIIFDELVEMFKLKTNIPDDIEFPQVGPKLNDYSFPSSILTDDILINSLAQDRLDRIRNCILAPSETGIEKIFYVAPWTDEDIPSSNIDFIISQAVLEHIDDLENAYAFFSKILSPNGYMSHEIDFKCHNIAHRWNGHWGYSEKFWKICRGKLSYLINRQPFSVHKNFCEKYNFCIVETKKIHLQENSIKRKQLKYPFQEISEDDFKTSSAYLLCSVKLE